MKQDKFLTGILIGVGALILLALGLFFTRQDKREYIADNVPEGVAHNYVLAILNKDYEKATRLAERAAVDADYARTKATTAKSKKAAEEMRKSIDTLRQEVERLSKE